MGSDRKPILIFVHGTGATGEENPRAENASRWWQPHSQFDKWLCERLVTAEGQQLVSGGPYARRFVWSGANSETARDQAGTALAEMIRELNRAKHSIHIIAHSHGGNVARKAIELLGDSGTDSSCPVKSLVSFGTPFFHYSRISPLLASIIPILIAASIFLYGPTRGSLTEGNVTRFILATATYVFALMTSLFGLSSLLLGLTKITEGRRKRGVSFIWKNFYSVSDEAIGLLMSFNSPIDLMRRNQLATNVSVWALLPLVAVGAFLGLASIVFVFSSIFGETSDWHLALLCLSGMGVVLAIFLGVTFAGEGVNYALDVLITSKLKAVAYGDDLGNGMSKVERFPWPGMEGVAVPIEENLDRAMEAYVASRTASLWASVRRGLIPDMPLLRQDLRSIAEKALTGDELAHTVYYHQPEFADLVAETLAATGDWQRVSTASAM